MPQHTLLHLNRQAYLDSTAEIEDAKSIAFAAMAKEWWDRHFSWRADPCVVLCDAEGNHLSYLFYKIDRYREYLTIHNLFTPLIHRRQGYAHELLSLIFEGAAEASVQRFRLTSISQSLDFYLTLGFIYWGVNSVGDYYCDLPLPDSGLDGVDAMVAASTQSELLGGQKKAIMKKIEGNSQQLTTTQSARHEKDKKRLGEHYIGLEEG